VSASPVLAIVPVVPGTVWATARKRLSLKDVAAAGGWKCTETLLRCYQQPDKRTMLDVVLGGAELRERKA
jgi:hypothetical protein